MLLTSAACDRYGKLKFREESPWLAFDTSVNGYWKAFLNWIKKISEAATRGVLCKKDVLRNWQNSQGNTCARASFLIKLQAYKFIGKIEKWLVTAYF